MKQTIEGYVNQARQIFPFIPREQLISMVILHFDIADELAKTRVDEITGRDIPSAIIPPSQHEYWVCWNCGEQNHDDFFDCWKCHKPKTKPEFMDY